jgi:Flp pilus assembly protein TadD
LGSEKKNAIDRLLADAGRAASAKALEKAADLASKALALDENHLKALDLMGFIRFFQGEYRESEACCRRALQVKPEHAYALSGLGMSLARQGRLEEGLEMMTRAMTVKPDWPEPYWDMAVILLESGDRERAAQILERGQTNAPSAARRFQGLLLKIQNEDEGR